MDKRDEQGCNGRHKVKGGESRLTLLSPGTGSLSSELLGLHSSGVGDQQGSVVLDQSLLELEGGSSVLVLGEVTVYSVRSESACLVGRRKLSINRALTQRHPWQ